MRRSMHVYATHDQTLVVSLPWREGLVVYQTWRGLMRDYGYTLSRYPLYIHPPEGTEPACVHGLALDMHCCDCQRRGFFPPDDCTCYGEVY